jgi:hypothetical protein
MVMAAAVLASGLAAMDIVDTEAEAIDNFVSAWSDYAYDSSILAIPATPGTLEASLTAMRGALIGMNAENAGSGKIQDGIEAFWDVALPAAATIWLIPPPNVLTSVAPIPGLSGIAAALDGVFAANTSGDLDKIAATTAMANAIHPLQLGGIATITPPAPATPFTAPLL